MIKLTKTPVYIFLCPQHFNVSPKIKKMSFMITILRPIIVQHRQEAFCANMITNIGWISPSEENITFSSILRITQHQRTRHFTSLKGWPMPLEASIGFVNNHWTGLADCKLSKREIISRHNASSTSHRTLWRYYESVTKRKHFAWQAVCWPTISTDVRNVGYSKKKYKLIQPII